MKKLLRLTALLLVAVCALGFAACSKYNALKGAFEKQGYTESQDVEKWTDEINKEINGGEKKDMVTNIHVLSKVSGLSSTIVLILEFKATDDMIDFYKESATAQGFVKDVSENQSAKDFYNALVEGGYACGNCLVISANPLAFNEVTGIVKSVK